MLELQLIVNRILKDNSMKMDKGYEDIQMANKYMQRYAP